MTTLHLIQYINFTSIQRLSIELTSIQIRSTIVLAKQAETPHNSMKEQPQAKDMSLAPGLQMINRDLALLIIDYLAPRHTVIAAPWPLYTFPAFVKDDRLQPLRINTSQAA